MGRQQKSGGNAAGKGSASKGGSSAAASSNNGGTGQQSSPWPSDVRYLTSLVWGDDVIRAKELYRKYKVSGNRPVEASPASVKKTVRWQLITDEKHPAKGEHGLFTTRKLEKGQHIIDYLGYVSLKGNESQTSDYTASFGDDNELALDAEKMGNEARMINDFRNTGRRANALFDQYRDAAGDMKLGVFVGRKGEWRVRGGRGG